MSEGERVNNAYRVPLIMVLCIGLAGCDPATLGGGEKPEPGVVEATRDGPPGASPGTCWGRTVSPAVIETVTNQVQVKPAQVNSDGTIGAPPVYRTEARQQIVSQRVDNWFETPCPEALSAEFNSSLQRALSVRGYYIGQINGKMDAGTRAAVQAFQRLDGPDSGVLSLATARKLGLIAVERTPSE